MVQEFTKSLCVAGVGIVWVDESADVWVFQIFAVHLGEVDALGGSNEAEGAVKFVVVVGGFCENVVLCHVVGDLVHGSFGEKESAYGVLNVFDGFGGVVEFRCYPSGPTRVVDGGVGDCGKCMAGVVFVVVLWWSLSVVRECSMCG